MSSYEQGERYELCLWLITWRRVSWKKEGVRKEDLKKEDLWRQAEMWEFSAPELLT